jgi:hypothetical protein
MLEELWDNPYRVILLVMVMCLIFNPPNTKIIYHDSKVSGFDTTLCVYFLNYLKQININQTRG